MNFTDSIRNIIKRLFGVDPVTTGTELAFLDEAEAKYRQEQGYNITAMFAGKLATQTVIDSTVNVVGTNQRAEIVEQVFQKVWMDAKKWLATAYGTGGVLLIPYVINDHIYVDAVPQSSMVINRINGDDLRAVSILADSTVQGDKQFFRWTDYDLSDDGHLTIRQRAVNEMNRVVPLTDLAEWANITEEMVISNCEHLLFAYIKNPTDPRTRTNYGVPITFGCDDKIKEIIECLADIRKEYKLKRPMVGIDPLVFDVKGNRRNLPVTGLFMPSQSGMLEASGKMWEVYDPGIRDSAYYNRLQHLYEELEKQVGTSRGILTERTSSHGSAYAATATEIKAANLDTYSIIDGMRKVVEYAFDRLLYACDVLINVYGLAPMGEMHLAYDWSYSLIESTSESYQQLLTSVSAGAVEPAELRQFTFPNETLEEARARCEEIRRMRSDLADELMKEALAREASRQPVTVTDEPDEE